MSIDAPPQDTAPAEIATKSSAPVNTTLLVLIFSYGAVLFAFVPATVRALSQAWSAVSDDAVIAIRTSDALTWAGPLLGQHTLVTSAHSVFDPGPLQYWLLAIPVRIDPQHGALWGAALWCIVAGLITVEATRRAAGPFGAAIAALLLRRGQLPAHPSGGSGNRVRWTGRYQFEHRVDAFSLFRVV
jgi:hypothetical protein